MMSKCGENKKVAHKAIAVFHWCSYHILTSSVICYWTGTQQYGIYLFYMMIKKQKNFNGVIYASVLQLIISKNQSKCANNLTHNTRLHLALVWSSLWWTSRLMNRLPQNAIWVNSKKNVESIFYRRHIGGLKQQEMFQYYFKITHFPNTTVASGI